MTCRCQCHTDPSVKHIAPCCAAPVTVVGHLGPILAAEDIKTGQMIDVEMGPHYTVARVWRNKADAPDSSPGVLGREGSSPSTRTES